MALLGYSFHDMRRSIQSIGESTAHYCMLPLDSATQAARFFAVAVIGLSDGDIVSCMVQALTMTLRNR